MKSIHETLIAWLPFAFAVGLSFLVLSSLRQDMKFWEPAFYSFLPMCFFFGAFALHRTMKEVRELREKVAQLEAAERHANGA